jgi:hypothetical protein
MIILQDNSSFPAHAETIVKMRACLIRTAESQRITRTVVGDLQATVNESNERRKIDRPWKPSNHSL